MTQADDSVTTLADRAIAALRAHHTELTGVVGGSDSDDLARTSGSAEWDVAQVLSHLGSGAEITLGVLEAGLAGGEPPSQRSNEAVWDRWNAMDRAEQASGFVTADGALVARLEGLDATARQTAQIQWFLPAPVDLDLFVGMRLAEVTQHGWDVRVATDPGAALAPAAVEPVLDTLTGPAAFVIGFQGQADRWSGSPVAIRVETVEPARTVGLTIGDTVVLGEAPAEADAVLRAPAEAFLRLLSGRLAPEHTPDSVSVDGAITLDQLRQVFPGY